MVVGSGCDYLPISGLDGSSMKGCKYHHTLHSVQNFGCACTGLVLAAAPLEFLHFAPMWMMVGLCLLLQLGGYQSSWPFAQIVVEFAAASSCFEPGLNPLLLAPLLLSFVMVGGFFDEQRNIDCWPPCPQDSGLPQQFSSVVVNLQQNDLMPPEISMSGLHRNFVARPIH